MREKYLRKLLELITEMRNERQQLDSLERNLLRVLEIVLTAFWFYQIDYLWSYVAAWKLDVSHIVIDDALDLVEIGLADAAAEAAGVSMVTEEEAAEDWERNPSVIAYEQTIAGLGKE